MERKVCFIFEFWLVSKFQVCGRYTRAGLVCYFQDVSLLTTKLACVTFKLISSLIFKCSSCSVVSVAVLVVVLRPDMSGLRRQRVGRVHAGHAGRSEEQCV